MLAVEIGMYWVNPWVGSDFLRRILTNDKPKQ